MKFIIFFAISFALSTNAHAQTLKEGIIQLLEKVTQGDCEEGGKWACRELMGLSLVRSEEALVLDPFRVSLNWIDNRVFKATLVDRNGQNAMLRCTFFHHRGKNHSTLNNTDVVLEATSTYTSHQIALKICTLKAFGTSQSLRFYKINPNYTRSFGATYSWVNEERFGYE